MLEAQKDNLEAQIAALEDEYAENNEQMEQKRSELLAKLSEIEEKIADKTQKREEAERKLIDLAKEKNKLQEHYDDLMREKVKMFNNILDGSFFDDAAQRGEEIAAVAAALFLGYIDQATTFARGSGGGGGSPGTGWGRDKDEDDEAYRRRCCIMGRMMMKPAGRKLKR